MADCKWPSRARIPGGLVPGTVARGRLAFLAARTVTAPPGRDMANSATSPILRQRQPELQVGGVAYRCPIEFRHQVGTLGRPTWRTTAPGGRTLFGRWFPGAVRSAIPSDIECSADCYRVGFGFKTEISRCALDLHMSQECSDRLQIAGTPQNVESLRPA